MRLWILSDLHLEDGVPLPSVAPGFDVLVCAGDVVEGSPAKSVEAVARLARGSPAVLVLGNHDVWWQTLEGALEEARAHGARLGVHVLEDTAVDIDGVRFHGATLWTGSLASGSEETDPDRMSASRCMCAVWSSTGEPRSGTSWLSQSEAGRPSRLQSQSPRHRMTGCRLS
jgi:hypothetical protein